MTPAEINDLHMSGMQFPLDSDEIDKALADANLDPTTCTYAEAGNACQRYANAIQAFGQPPTRGGRREGAGAPRGNQNNKRDVVRPHRIQIHVSDDELAAITAAAGDVPLARWVREAALEKQSPTETNFCMAAKSAAAAAPSAITISLLALAALLSEAITHATLIFSRQVAASRPRVHFLFLLYDPAAPISAAGEGIATWHTHTKAASNLTSIYHLTTAHP